MPPVLTHASLFHAVVLMNVLFAAAVWSLMRPSYRAAGVLAVVAVAWLFWNQPLEGRVLVSISLENGLTESDLLSGVALVIAAVTARREHERRKYED